MKIPRRRDLDTVLAFFDSNTIILVDLVNARAIPGGERIFTVSTQRTVLLEVMAACFGNQYMFDRSEEDSGNIFDFAFAKTGGVLHVTSSAPPRSSQWWQ